MDPFNVVRLAGDALDRAGAGSSRGCTRTVAARTTRSTGLAGPCTPAPICSPTNSKTDSLYRARRTLHTGADLLTDKQQDRLDALFGVDDHVEVEVSWWIYQRMIPAYREPDRTKGRELMGMLIDSISHCIPAALIELITLGRTLKKRADDVLATSTGRVRPTDRPRRSTAGSNTSTDPPSGFAISPTTSPDHSWNPGVSGRDYTSDCEEPHIKTPEAIWSLT
jgi:hypothetical protein